MAGAEISSFFRFPFYRLFFSLVVGIIALESFALTLNFKNQSNHKIIDGILLRIEEKRSEDFLNIPKEAVLKLPIWIKNIRNPHENEIHIKTKNFHSKNTATLTIKSGAYIVGDPTIKLEEIPDLVISIGNLKLWIFYKFKDWNFYVFAIVAIIATLIGELICSLSDIVLGLIFGYNPFSCDERIENCTPITGEVYIGVKNFENINQQILEFSELHFLISRVLMGLLMVTLTTLLFLLLTLRAINLLSTSLLLPLIIAFIIISCIKNRQNVSLKWIILVILLIITSVCLIVLSCISFSSPAITPLVTIANTLLILLTLAVIYRTQANRFIKYGTTDRTDN